MDPSIWTQVAAYIGCEDLSTALPALCGLGWRCFELSTEHLQLIEDAPDRQRRIERAVEQLAALGARMPQAHALLAADVAHGDPARRDADMDRVWKNLRTCAALGVKVVVVHPGTGGCWRTRDEYRTVLETNARQFRILGDQAGELGLRIALENLFDPRSDRRGRRFGSLPCELLELLGGLGHPALGVCLDTSHANVQGLDVAQAVRDFAPYLIATHLSDNDGSGDQHRTPGYGKIDWAPVMAAFAEAGYPGPLNLEIPGEAGPCRALVRLKVRQALEVTRRLIALVRAGGHDEVDNEA
ncbi:MAG TPA: sugar phosphate isomerase/epimerase family protein [Phycisphaerae bacterium]|nr:sugar phosphate isomerase/epimerase family protein [Phycisphaerae bacterium]